ncbi:MAG: hypothetical protein CBD91_06400 [Phycisphaeraceae bacterium TMED231]|nr:MAG: hypothetical protein CBD91_06400 [Phycisphaeraceae bacterium TMED231]
MPKRRDRGRAARTTLDRDALNANPGTAPAMRSAGGVSNIIGMIGIIRPPALPRHRETVPPNACAGSKTRIPDSVMLDSNRGISGLPTAPALLS